MRGRLRALCLLLLAFFRTIVRSLTGSRRGVAAFRANYDADALAPVTAEERVWIGGFGCCIACGLCDRGEAERVAGSKGRYAGVMSLVLAGSRSMPEYRAAAHSFGLVPEEVLAQRELVCPADVPLRQLARFVRRKARELGPSSDSCP